MSKVLTGAYRTRHDAIRAAEGLMDAGFTREEISLLAPEEHGGSHNFSIEPKRRALAGAGCGALFGLAIGAAAGALQTAAAVAIPAFEFSAGGPLVSALTGAGAGAAIGALIGAVVGMSRTEHAAVMRNGDGNGGFVLVGVAPPHRAMLRSARTVLESAGAEKILTH